jgi:N utilization substance protein A
VKVKIDEKKKTATVSMPDDQLSLAIGKDGQNVRLAARLTGYKIDIKGATKAARIVKSEEGDELVRAGLSKRVANVLAKAGVTTVKALKKMPEEKRAKIKGLGPKALKEIKKLLK